MDEAHSTNKLINGDSPGSGCCSGALPLFFQIAVWDIILEALRAKPFSPIALFLSFPDFNLLPDLNLSVSYPGKKRSNAPAGACNGL